MNDHLMTTHMGNSTSFGWMVELELTALSWDLQRYVVLLAEMNESMC